MESCVLSVASHIKFKISEFDCQKSWIQWKIYWKFYFYLVIETFMKQTFNIHVQGMCNQVKNYVWTGFVSGINRY